MVFITAMIILTSTRHRVSHVVFDFPNVNVILFFAGGHILFSGINSRYGFLLFPVLFLALSLASICSQLIIFLFSNLADFDEVYFLFTVRNPMSVPQLSQPQPVLNHCGITVL